MMNDCTSCFYGFDHQTTVHCYSERLLYPMIKLRIYKGPLRKLPKRSQQGWRLQRLVQESMEHMPRYCYTPSQGHRLARGVHGVEHRTTAPPRLSQIRRFQQRNAGRRFRYCSCGCGGGKAENHAICSIELWKRGTKQTPEGN